MVNETIPFGDAPGGDASGRIGLKQLAAAALPEYEIGEELGRGSSGVVFACTHRDLGRLTAVKVLAPNVAADPNIRARFVAEAEVLAALDHRGIVAIYDFVESAGLCLLVMERVPGRTLWTQFSKTGMTWPGSCVAMVAVCEALEHAHRRGVLHRDVKPGNVLVSDRGDVKVIDFGIAKVIGGANSHATSTGQLLGTPAYMAPEQIAGGDLSERTDVYGAGTMFYELLCGDVPYLEADNVYGMLGRKIREPPDPLPLRDPDVPAAIAEVAMQSVAHDARDRFPTAGAFGAAIASAAGHLWGSGWAEAPAAAAARDAAMIGGRNPKGGGGRPTDARTVFPKASGHVDGRFAVAVHEVYRAWRAVEARVDDAPASEWEDLPEALKVSSQAFADDIFAKIQAIGCTVHPVFDRDVVVLELSEVEVEDLARKEHRRWVAEREGNGWTPGPKDVATKTTPYLVPWRELPEHIKEYDRVLVRNIPEILARVHLEIRRTD